MTLTILAASPADFPESTPDLTARIREEVWQLWLHSGGHPLAELLESVTQIVLTALDEHETDPWPRPDFVDTVRLDIADALGVPLSDLDGAA